MTDRTPAPALLSIGAFSRASGLSVSALRFYDTQQVLTPAVVDPITGYRRYGHDQIGPGRLIAGMRRLQVPLAEMSLALTALARDPQTATDLLHAHLSRMEEVRCARREVLRLADLVREVQSSTATDAISVIRAPAFSLWRALRSVRYAAGDDPAYPVLSGVLVETSETGTWVAATDRFRLAAARVCDPSHGRTAGGDGTAASGTTRVALPIRLVRRILARHPAPTTGTATITAPALGSGSGGRPTGQVRVLLGEDTIDTAAEVVDDYPDVHRLIARAEPGHLEQPRMDLPTDLVRDRVKDMPGDGEVVITATGRVLPADGAAAPPTGHREVDVRLPGVAVGRAERDRPRLAHACAGRPAGTGVPP